MAKYMDSENFKHFWNNILKPNLLKKVDKVSGKGLSTNDFTDTYKNAIGSLQDSVGALNTTKVDKVIGKDLSTNDFTNEYKDLIVANKDAISKLKGFIYPCTAQALEEMSQEQQAELHTQGYRAIKTENNGTVVLLGLGSDGSLEWLGCNQPRGNLLDNGNFINPVNQRGVTSALSSSSYYFIDRWMTYQTKINNVTYSLVDNGISLTPVEHGNYAGMQQRIETPLSTGEDYTIIFSVDGDNIVLPVTGGTDKIGEETNNIYLSYTTNYGGYNTVRVIFTTNRSFVVNNARVIKGSYTPKTLPPWETTKYADSYLECSRHFNIENLYTCTTSSNNSFSIHIPFRIPMRVIPTTSVFSTITGAEGYADVLDGSEWKQIVVYSEPYQNGVRVFGTSNGTNQLVKFKISSSADL